MIIKEVIASEEVRLVQPIPKRDSATSVKWLEGDSGRETLKLMGVLVPDNFIPNIKTETKRIKKMIKSKDEYIAMIEYKNRIVGSLEIWTVQYDRVPSPSISIMIGCPSMRGISIGKTVLNAVHNVLSKAGYEVSNARTLLANPVSNIFFETNGYEKDGYPYTDENSLVWQNYKNNLSQ